jgi:hypothetical protein
MREIGRLVGAVTGAGRKGEAGLGIVDGSRRSGRVTDDLRRAEDPPDADGLCATTLDTETEVVAGVVTVGRLVPGVRRGGVDDVFSSSISFRFGDEFNESTRRLGVSTPVLGVLCPRSLSFSSGDDEEDGADGELAPPLEDRERVAAAVWGLPPARAFPFVPAAPFVKFAALVDGELPPVFLRSLAGRLNGLALGLVGDVGERKGGKGGPRD